MNKKIGLIKVIRMQDRRILSKISTLRITDSDGLSKALLVSREEDLTLNLGSFIFYIGRNALIGKD